MSSKFPFFLLVTFGLGIATADVYTWVDEEGQVHYSDKPEVLPADVVNVRTQRGNVSVVGAQPRDEQERYLSDARELREQQQAEDAAEEDKLRQETLAERAAACEKAQQRHENYTNAHRLYRPTADGEREYLSDEEIDEARAEAAAAVDQWCN